MVFNYIAKHMFGYDDSENTSEDKISEKFTKISEFLMSIPLNVPGTTYHKCLKVLWKNGEIEKLVLLMVIHMVTNLSLGVYSGPREGNQVSEK